jgi:hypothetical protein
MKEKEANLEERLRFHHALIIRPRGRIPRREQQMQDSLPVQPPEIQQDEAMDVHEAAPVIVFDNRMMPM